MKINPSVDHDDRNLFWNLVNNINCDCTTLLDYVNEHPEVLTRKIKHHIVFDFFYEKAVNDRCHPAQSNKWQESLIEVVNILEHVDNSDIIKHNKKYILRLQGTCKTLTKIFGLFIQEEFDMGDPEFLVYSIIARGELDKLQILSKLYVIEDYPGVLDVALRYGRNAILTYFIDTMEIEVPYYGKIMDFENYTDNTRYIYYREHIAHDDTLRQKVIVGASKQDYLESIKIILKYYQYDITYKTIEKWCELIKSKEFVWDRINPSEILPILIEKLEKPIPLTYDFGEFNNLIFGKEWSDRKFLVEHCINLRTQLENEEYRRTCIEERYRQLQTKYDSIMSWVENKVGGRVRRETM